MEIEDTLEKVCVKVLSDHSIAGGAAALVRRREALLALGTVYTRVSSRRRGNEVEEVLAEFTANMQQQQQGQAAAATGGTSTKKDAE